MSARAKTLIKYVVPTILGQVSFFLFTIFDGIFVGQGVGTDALGAVNLVFPFVMIANALFMLTTIGGVTITAIRLGRGDREGANQAFMHAVAGTILISLLLFCTGVFLTDPLCQLMGSNATYHPMMKEYLFYYSLFLIPSALMMMLNGFGRNDGAPLLVSASTIIGTLLNILGDWIFVFPLRMGLMGAALATGISQTISLFIILPHFLCHRGALRFQTFRVSKPLCSKLLLRGLPETIAQFATPVSTLWTNFVLLRYMGDIGVNAFSIICYVASFSVAVFYGASEGLQPLFGQSYGAKRAKDLRYFFVAGILISLIGSTMITTLLCLGCRGICALFGADSATLDFTVHALPQYAWGFVIMALNTMISSYFYSTKRSKQAILINLLRSFAVNSVIILTLPALLGGSIIWHTFGIYETIVLVVALILLLRSERKGVLSE